MWQAGVEDTCAHQTLATTSSLIHPNNADTQREVEVTEQHKAYHTMTGPLGGGYLQDHRQHAHVRREQVHGHVALGVPTSVTDAALLGVHLSAR